jgi:hypothetical protein
MAVAEVNSDGVAGGVEAVSVAVSGCGPTKSASTLIRSTAAPAASDGIVQIPPTGSYDPIVTVEL